MEQQNKLASIFILIRSLGVGGAERQVSVLAKALHERGIKVTVGLFYSGGALEEELRQAGVSIYLLEKQGRWDLVGWFWRYIKAIRKVNPDVIYSFLTTSNIVAIIGSFFIRKPVVWGIRASVINYEEYDWMTKLSCWLEKKLSRFVKTIIFNARFSYIYHKTLGYFLNDAIVVPNGIDTDLFKLKRGQSRSRTRAQLGIPEDALVVGMLSRVDPMKDYHSFIKAASILSYQHTDLYFITAGMGTDTVFWPSLPSRFLRLGVYKDVSGLLNAMDIMVLCSFGEGFPNVIGEAMACGIPVIATDVGDAAYIVSDLGIIIPPKNPEALVQAIETLLEKPPSKEAIRKRIVSHFGVQQMVELTLQTLTRACRYP